MALEKLARDNIWVVVPAYNETAYIERVLKKILEYTKNIIVIDDGSTDGTAELAKKMGVCTLRNRLNSGKGATLRTGCDFAFNHCGASAIVIMDADDQHEASELPKFFAEFAKGEQVVFGIREEPNMPWLRLKLNRLGSFVNYLLFGVYILDIPSGFKAFTKEAYSKLRWFANDYAVELEIAARTAKYRLHFSTIHIKSIYHDMNRGMTAFDVINTVKYLLKLKAFL
jgi:glycosyltransferase involved in cell wall biosynthesis